MYNTFLECALLAWLPAWLKCNGMDYTTRMVSPYLSKLENNFIFRCFLHFAIEAASVDIWVYAATTMTCRRRADELLFHFQNIT